MPVMILVGIAGAIGAVLRYGLSFLLITSRVGSFPQATLAANLIGCFLLAFFTARFMGKRELSEKIKTAVTTGLLGSFTTFSTFSVETILLFQNKGIAAAFAYIAISSAGGLLLTILGFFLGKRLDAEGGRP
ncbi:fluoride efflux transporter CrcB [Pueribacillus theae]|uniref:Fluoride-specific ion channel FluC n=1 Tax=Pueribacillus theae TaxID=2171751 RepID=A0A2U1JZP5_9BACI|nr:fluoride efflux transporter CrcB [Pueribacillus theae]PWA10691.1 fluoride efflux transporter CrcB [Pueribacillus theae]